MALPPLENSDQGIISVSVDFPSNLKWDAPFHYTAYDCLMVIETVLVINGGCSMYIFKISASAAVLFPNFVSGFRLELMFVFIIVNIRLSHLLDFQLL